MARTLKKLTRGGFQNLFTSPEGDLEVAVLGQGTKMITRTRITGIGAVVEVEVDMNVSVSVMLAGTGIVSTMAGAGAKVGAAVGVLLIAETVEEASIMMSDAVEVGLMEVLPLFIAVLVLDESHLQGDLCPGMKVQMLRITKNDQPLQRVCLLVLFVMVLKAHLQVLKLMNKGAGAARCDNDLIQLLLQQLSWINWIFLCSGCY